MLTLSLKKLTSWFKINCVDIVFSVIILLITIFVAFKNYTPNTFLTGWDNLHPEFNFKLNIVRSLNAVWQEYQGVGLLGGMSHAADLPRQIFLNIVSVFVPISFIRYFWTFLMLFFGPWGVYFLFKDKSKLGGFAASMFYLFNLATVQYFYVPFETFVSFFGFLPWLIYFFIDYLKTGKKLWKYFLISIFATPAFYVQTLFVVYGIFLTVLSLKNFKRSIFLFLTTFFVNAFWLIPVLWFTYTSGAIPSDSEINRIATPETILMNQSRNDFKDVVTLKGYWFDYYDFGTDQKFDYLFRPWIDYSSTKYVEAIGIILFGVAVLGLLISGEFLWAILLVIGYLMLSGFKIPIPVLEEAFRNSFTKWSVAFSFVISVGLGNFITKIGILCSRWLKILPLLFMALVACASVYVVSPVLSGKLISERVRINIPNEYFESFEWLNNLSNGGRVAYFPAFDKWGWNYHDWGYGGSGFMWYGIKNPILDRAFNVWSTDNENYYNQVTKAILDGDEELFKNVINKYKVKYLFLDSSVVYPWGDKSLLKLETIRSFSRNLGYEEAYRNNFIMVFDTGFVDKASVSPINSFSRINTDIKYSKVDNIYQKYGNYVKSENGIVLPFTNFDPRGFVQIKHNQDQLKFSNFDAKLSLVLPAENVTKESFESTHGFQEAYNCDLQKNGQVYRSSLETGRQYRSENGGVVCDYFVFGDLNYANAYVMHIKGKNITGRSLKVYLFNWQSKRAELEELLPGKDFDSYFVIYPKEQLDNKNTVNAGYTLNIETRSFGRIASENIIESIEFIPFDINYVQNIEANNGMVLDSEYGTNNLEVKNVKKYGTALYKVDTFGRGLLQLGQGYEAGWLGYLVSGNKIEKLSHLEVNGWSNGWIIPNKYEKLESRIYLFFWPQILEWAGFLLLLLTMVYLIVKSKKLS